MRQGILAQDLGFVLGRFQRGFVDTIGDVAPLIPFLLTQGQIILFRVGIFGTTSLTFSKVSGTSAHFQKLVQSYALDALDWPGEEKEDQVPAASVRRFLEGVRRAPKKAYPSLGLGENVQIDGPFVSGAAMVHEGKVLHLSAFSHPGQRESGTKVPFQRFSQRRKR